jgi:hypothetical protein
MPKAKPISLHPLSFEEVIDVLVRASLKVEKQKQKPKKKPT